MPSTSKPRYEVQQAWTEQVHAVCGAVEDGKTVVYAEADGLKLLRYAGIMDRSFRWSVVFEGGLCLFAPPSSTRRLH